MSVTEPSDAGLVAEVLAGRRDAFGKIVSRYQSLICSLAYSATGSLGRSEDLAQETFIAAWKQLSDLREPSRLRSWLCGIARNQINGCLRREGREPLREAEPLESAHASAAHEPSPPDQAISREEEAILWRSLERIPALYREPLVLFYREHQSVETVAAELELFEDAVKQRLSRGRRLLHEEVLAFVEGTLARTNPGKAFTFGVLAALPVFATSASAATVAGAAAKGSVTALSSALVTVFASLLGPIIGVLGGGLGGYRRSSLWNPVCGGRFRGGRHQLWRRGCGHHRFWRSLCWVAGRRRICFGGDCAGRWSDRVAGGRRIRDGLDRRGRRPGGRAAIRTRRTGPCASRE